MGLIESARLKRLHRKPKIGFNFRADGAFDPRITFTRSTAALRNDSTGDLESIAIDVARANANQDYNPSTLAARGFLIEAGATNQIRNPRAEGAAAPSTFPTNWLSSPASGITTTVIGAGSEDGIPYIDVKYAGTSTGLSNLFFDSSVAITASSGQSWAGSAYVKIQGGTTTNVDAIQLILREGLSGGGFVASTVATVAPDDSHLSAQRFPVSVAATNASTQRVILLLTLDAGGAIDITLRIGAPQLEQNAFATSLILPPVSSPAATARGTDNAVISNLASIGFSATQGFVYVEFMLEGLGATTQNRVCAFTDGTTNNEIAVLVNDNSGDAPTFYVVNGGLAQCAITSSAVTANTLIKVAASWAANNFRFAVNGVAASPDTSGSIPTVDRLEIGREISGANYLNGWLRTLQYGPQLLTSAQLASMTA